MITTDDILRGLFVLIGGVGAFVLLSMLAIIPEWRAARKKRKLAQLPLTDKEKERRLEEDNRILKPMQIEHRRYYRTCKCGRKFSTLLRGRRRCGRCML